MMLLTRRLALLGIGGSLVSGCDRLGKDESFRALLASAEQGNLKAHRALVDRMALAREFAPSQRSPQFRANGTTQPKSEEYDRSAKEGFAGWQLVLDGEVAAPQKLSLGQIKAMPRRDQITRHDCVEGWSAIGKWTGVPLKLLLDTARLKPAARYLVIHCADRFGNRPYYESIDLVDGFHPQTILAWALNDQLLPVANGAPLRLRVERQLGYKHAKYVQRIEAVTALAHHYGGKGGFWEDVAGYEWYAGI